MFSMLLATTPASFVFAEDPTSSASTTTSPVENSSSPSGDATITTGDAVSVTDAVNVVNTTATNPSTTPEQTSGESLPASEQGQAQNSESSATTTPTTVSADILNEAEVLNNASGTASTGDNSATSNSGDATVSTGNAVSTVNIANVVNTTIFNSQGFILLLNGLFGEVGTIDTRPLMSGNSNPTIPCGGNCAFFPSSVNLNSSSTASVTNNIIARASTGSNGAEGDNAFIDTGEAFAGVNLVNIANTNITNSSYMVVAFNNLGDWGGDLVLPGKEYWSKFFNPAAPSLNQNSNGGGSSVSVGSENSANVENGVGVVSDTGGNGAETEGGGASIHTGEAVSSSNVVNSVNKNFFGSDSFLVVFRVFGNWTGNVFSAPPGMSWQETEEGLQIMYDEDTANQQISGGTDGSESNNSDSGASISVTNKNDASIKNNVTVYALTGANKAKGDSGAAVATGDAYAAANIVNLANTNIFGRNWILAVFNIFGNWSGNVAFGRPDLWVGTEIMAKPEGVEPGSSVDYKFTIANRGDADASNVILENRFNSRLVSFRGFQAGSTLAGTDPDRFDLGGIPAGAVKEFTYSAQISRDAQYGNTNVANQARVYSYEPDGDTADNADYASLLVHSNILAQDGVTVNFTPEAALSVKKLNNAPFGVNASSTVGYTITIENRGGPAYHAVLEDVLKNEAGEVVGQENFDLGTILPDEEITVNYGTFFNPDAPPGRYTNFAQVKAVGRSPILNPFYGNNADSNIATSSIIILAPDQIPEIPIIVEPPEEIEEAPAITTIDRIIKPPVVEVTNENDLKNLNSNFPPLTPTFPVDFGGPNQLFGGGGGTAIVVTTKPIPLPRGMDLAALILALVGISLNRFYSGGFRNSFASF
ncbi:MAG: hypothetical protein A2836_03865 [Candidatus Taylorbacteria bacterium RIFCSPHIGHO2_01_FULL_45_63]|nr:MAG: hypothetical protein A2836_03865 [Candidatus Taylorbacteria bacterium RIFCSPHIGHO2_01_FULL_45_63]